ncbi:hypothetical protein SCL_2512 [Sulfuricaulis limicola]|uniref:Uncharacterized protein n=1 Tax=Sulfuricaulis limicola TaxID=1620215 RepID=A0A1B4XJ08_9GAMM|nr:hypothetical protein SCL_2512 [Sulfuricaulis limicola]
MPPSTIARATASQPRQHIGRGAPSMSTRKSLPGGTGKPQWKQPGESAVLAGSVWVAEMDMGCQRAA